MAFAQDWALLRTGGTPYSDLEIGRVYARSALVATQLSAPSPGGRDRRACAGGTALSHLGRSSGLRAGVSPRAAPALGSLNIW